VELSTILFAIAGLAALSYIAGRQRAILVGARDAAPKFHSLPGYHGAHLAFWCALPLLLIFAAWLVFEPGFLRASVLAALPPEFATASGDELSLIYNDIRNFVDGNSVAANASAAVVAAAGVYGDALTDSRRLLVVLLAVLAALLFLFAWPFGRHSAGALVHWNFWIALGWLLVCFGLVLVMAVSAILMVMANKLHGSNDAYAVWNLRARALGGTMQIWPGAEGGTRVEWRVPLSDRSGRP